MRPWEFHLPTAIHFGRGTLRKLGVLAADVGRSALLVGYRDPTGFEAAYRRAEESLAKAGLSVVPFYRVEPEPRAELVDACAESARQAGAELVIAVGGGSVIDVAKGAAALTPTGRQLNDCLTADPAPAPPSSLPVVAVPTTAGTGSEVTDIAVFSAAEGKKIAIFGPALRPRAALIDPDLAVGTPPELTAACGADALGHAIEACISRRANPMASLLAGQAAALIERHLERACADPQAPEPREALAWAATLAGAAFASSGVTAAHAVAQALGEVLGVPHARAVALATPPMLRRNAAACEEPYAGLARHCGLAGGLQFIERVEQLLSSLGLLAPPSLAAQPPDVMDRLVSAALAARVPLVQNPVRLDEAAVRAVIKETLGVDP